MVHLELDSGANMESVLLLTSNMRDHSLSNPSLRDSTQTGAQYEEIEHCFAEVRLIDETSPFCNRKSHQPIDSQKASAF